MSASVNDEPSSGSSKGSVNDEPSTGSSKGSVKDEPLNGSSKGSVKDEPSTGSSKGSKSFLIEDILDFKCKTGEETLNCSSPVSESKDSVDNVINQIKSVTRQVNSPNGLGNIVRPWDTASSTSLICSTASTIAAVAIAFSSNGLSNGLLSGSRGLLHHHHLHPQQQQQLHPQLHPQLHHSPLHHQHAPTTPSPIHHHPHHHHRNVHSGKHKLTPSNVRPRSADDDSQSERSESSDATIGGPDSPANSNLLPQNSPLECLYELTNKAFDRINGDKSMDGSSDHLNIFSNRPPPKKKRKSRTAFTNTQIFELERKFIQQRYLSPADRDDLASRLGLTGPQVITWFQNRRAKQKREVEETKNDLQNHVKTMYYPDIYDNIQDLSMLKVPDIRSSLQFHSKSP